MSHQTSGEILITEFSFSIMYHGSLNFICLTGDQPISMKSLVRGDVGTSGDDEIELEKSNILLIGPTGSGIVYRYVIFGRTMVTFSDGFHFFLLLGQVKHY